MTDLHTQAEERLEEIREALKDDAQFVYRTTARDLLAELDLSRQALRMACTELWAWRNHCYDNPPPPPEDVDDVVDEMLAKARGFERDG